MSKQPINKLGKLEDNPLWQEVCALAEYMYGILHEFPEEEKWDTERKLRTSANDAMYFVAQAIANGMPTSSEYDWANTRKSLSATKTLYRFAGRQKMIKLDPEIMVRIDTLLTQIDSETQNAIEFTKQYNENEIEATRQKYQFAKGSA